MADVCPDCGRPSERGEHEGMSWCIVRGSHSCMIVADAYQRGRRDGIDDGRRAALWSVAIGCAVTRWQSECAEHSLASVWYGWLAGKALDVLSMLGDAAAEKAKGE